VGLGEGYRRSREGCRGTGTHLVCGGLGRRVDRGAQEGQGALAAPRIRYQGGPEVQGAPAAQRYCPPWDPRQCESIPGTKHPGMLPPPHAPSPPVPWGTHRQPGVALGPRRPRQPRSAGTVERGAARLALLPLGTCIPLVTLQDGTALGWAAGAHTPVPQIVRDTGPTSHGWWAKGLPAGWHRSDSGRRESGLWRGRGEPGWARATLCQSLPAGTGHSPGGPGAPASPFSPF